jgi:nicotinate-nucleotide adenylyltransferase
VIFVPAGDPPHKPPFALAPARDRWRMVRLAVRGVPHCSVSPVELRRRGPSYTVDTVRAMHRRFRGRVLRFIVGADTVAEIPTWHRWRDLVRSVRFIVVARPGYRLRPLRGAAAGFDLVRVRGLRLSSTELRAMLRRGRSGGRALAPAVRDYIRRQGLYRA